MPNQHIGAVIGKGGSKIQLIQDTNGVKVQVSRKEDMGSDENRIVTITGSQRGREAAKAAMIGLVSESMQQAASRSY